MTEDAGGTESTYEATRGPRQMVMQVQAEESR